MYLLIVENIILFVSMGRDLLQADEILSCVAEQVI